MTNIDENFEINYGAALNKTFFRRDTETVAKELLGKILIKKNLDSYIAAKIVETEAYLPEGDLACHAAMGKTKRNAPMFEAGGILYAYFIYGAHHCINVVTESKGRAGAVLIRAAEPLTGLEKMSANRKIYDRYKLCRGPGNLAKAFGFSLADNYKSLTSEELFLQESHNNNFKIESGARIGINKSVNLQLRFYIKNSVFVSSSKK